MSAHDNGGPAFPSIEEVESPQPGHYFNRFHNGLTKREVFAMVAMHGWLASSPTVAGKKIDGSPEHAAELSAACVNYADALLTALKESQP